MKLSQTLNYATIAFCTLLLSCYHANQKGNTAVDQATAVSGTQLQANKALVLKLYDALNDSNFTLAKTFVDPSFTHHYVKDSGFGHTTWAGFEKGYRMSLKAFPDWKLSPGTIVAEGEYVSVLLSGKGTQQGEFAGIPATNIKAGAPIMLLHQIRDGKITADWEIMNTASFLEQIKKQ
ncbi:MAG: hypothetical protein JWQ27_3111 [Ferruginibacter sp.]|nr:hypothetical protein [Ferruginibacter sp.]